MAIDNSGDWWIGTLPEDIPTFLTAFIDEDGGYAPTAFKPVTCRCSSDRFFLERSATVTRRVCAACGQINFICRNVEDWEEAVAGDDVEPFACIECPCKIANVNVGFAGYDENPEIDGVKWFYVGVRCAECGILGCFNDGKVGWGPATEVYNSV